ncbi:DUF2786 domain-containing protein [Blastococcus sp. BMG 814]|uniref:DUF2786 domain-containing protein n=1 Tax=Blastococcus carthaginiensis TaxID=3050034 RepID=A0ABT9I656_9ACTN|nr:DUF2786 domain-containing protein [Blastococcus carthaginiensis]MDP5181049.1 DUF2786 domain-containing protein [Blastococcus carthaginiensis]
MIDDVWLADLLQHRAPVLTDAGAAAEVAATLSAQGFALDGGGLLSRTLQDALDGTWERGWQPADVAHAARRQVGAGSVPLLVALLAEHARRTDAVSRAPEGWVAQLRELGALDTDHAPAPGTAVTSWHRAERRAPAEAWRIVLQLTGMLRTTARIEVLVPPPSRWGPARTRAEGPVAADDDRALRRIRGLLAKAEATGFPEEAEALTAKAQELMTRHAVDAALLDGGAPAGVDVDTRRVHLADPYARAKTQLLGAVAEANDVRLVWYQGLGIATLVGIRSDLDAVELLFTSLLLQVAQALAAAERQEGRRSASRSFRRAFLLGYAHRIGERLAAARRRVTEEAAAERGADLLPVLRSRQEAVEARTQELFPRVRSSRSRSSVDAGGWYAGRAAAERADVAPRRSPLR